MKRDEVNELWVPVKGLEEYYAVSNLGRVKSNDRLMPNRNGYSQKKGRILKGRAINSGSVMITFVVDRVYKEILLHRLVAEHFLDDYDPEREVIHLDKDRQNNYYKNLEMGRKITRPVSDDSERNGWLSPVESEMNDQIEALKRIFPEYPNLVKWQAMNTLLHYTENYLKLEKIFYGKIKLHQ